MKEKVLSNKKHGMAVMLLTILLLLLATVGTVFGAILLDDGKSPALFVISIIVLCIGWLPLCGLRILKPQEALVGHAFRSVYRHDKRQRLLLRQSVLRQC